MKQKISIPAAIAAIITASSLTACSTSTDDQATSTDVVETATTVDAVDAADAADEFSTYSANPDTPPFPELGPFDPDLRGEDMPDPCTWATPEIMAELGYPVFTDAETFTDFRDCNYSEDSTNIETKTVSVSFFNLSAEKQPDAQLTDSDIPGLYIAPDHIFDFNGYAAVDTVEGSFEVGISSFDLSEAELQAEAKRVLEAIIERTP